MTAAGSSTPDWPVLALAVAVLAFGELGVATVRIGRHRQRIGLYEATLAVGLALVSSPWLVPAAVVAVALARSAVALVAGRRPLARPRFARWRSQHGGQPKADLRPAALAPTLGLAPAAGHTPLDRGRWGRPDGHWFAVALTATAVGVAVLASEAVLGALSSATTADPLVADVAAVALGALAGGGTRLAVQFAIAAVRHGPNRFTADSPLLAAGRLLVLALLANTVLGVAVVVLAANAPQTLLVTPAVVAALVAVYRTRTVAADDRQGWLQVDRLGDDFAGLDEEAVVDLVQRRAQTMFRAASARLRLAPGVPVRGLLVRVVPEQAGAERTTTGDTTSVPFTPFTPFDQADRADQADQADQADRVATIARARRTTAVAADACWAGHPVARLDVEFAAPVRWSPGDDLRLRAVARSAASALAHARLRERSQDQAELAAHAAQHDSLTGLGNRRLLVSRAADLLDSSPDGCIGLLLLDLDRFKEVNDTLGHATGDLLLRAVAETLRRGVRQADVVARVGGDEFAVLVTGIANPAQAEAAAAELVDLLCRSVEVDGIPLAVEVSVGVACHPDDGASIDELLQHADIAMYQAKQSHPRWRRYVPDDRAARLERLELVAELRSAISGGELVLNYQPQLELRTGQVKAVEALVRWNHPRRGLLTPAAFVPAVEQSGLIQVFTFAVLDQALRACAGWRANGFDVAVSVNLSAKNLMNTELPGEVAKLLVTRGVPASSLTLEITETARMVDVASALRLLRELRELGVRIAADDFGTGYSSMALIQERVLDEVKIDRSFVRRLLVEQGDAAIVAATVQLAHAHGLTVVAEGVESAGLLDALADLHCDQVQGLHVGPAMPLADLTSWLGGAERAPRRAVGDTVRIFPGPHRRPPASP